jgi:L-fuconolactonase
MSHRIDSHQHFWRLDRGDYGWLTPAVQPIFRDYLPEDLDPLIKRAGVGSTILVQAAPTLAESRYLLELAAAPEFIAGVVGWVDFESADAADTIASLSSDSKLVGLRPMVQDIADPLWMLKPQLAPAFDAMIDHDLTFDALVRPVHLDALRELSDLYPDLRLVVDHGAKPPLRDGDLQLWKTRVACIAAETPAMCKLSGLVTEALSASPVALAACVDHLLETFGPRRLMWGSDWPVCELVCSYEEWLQASEMLLVMLSGAERDRIYSGTAREFYGF